MNILDRLREATIDWDGETDMAYGETPRDILTCRDLHAAIAVVIDARKRADTAEAELASLRAELEKVTGERDRAREWAHDAEGRLHHETAHNDTLRAELEAVRLAPIEQSDGLVSGRDYIPLPGGWELQTKGTGSTFRIVDTKTGDRLAIPESPYLHETLERMAREIHAALVRIDGEKA